MLKRKYAVLAIAKRDAYALGEPARFFTRRSAERFMQYMNTLRLGQNVHSFTYVVKEVKR